MTGFADDETTAAKLDHIPNQVSGGKEVDGDNIREWPHCDMCEPRFEILGNDDIVRSLGREENDSNREGSRN
jgi:hypothetical protein